VGDRLARRRARLVKRLHIDERVGLTIMGEIRRQATTGVNNRCQIVFLNAEDLTSIDSRLIQRTARHLAADA
jgi:hypothetical protein